MEISIERKPSIFDATIGSLLINGSFECWSLEDEVREQPGVEVVSWKIPGKTAIPKGRYKVIIDFSNRFQRMMPHILDVPGYEGIRVHSGNTAIDTDGCIILGQTKDERSVHNSKIAFDIFYKKLQSALSHGEMVWITIQDIATELSSVVKT